MWISKKRYQELKNELKHYEDNERKAMDISAEDLKNICDYFKDSPVKIDKIKGDGKYLRVYYRAEGKRYLRSFGYNYSKGLDFPVDGALEL